MNGKPLTDEEYHDHWYGEDVATFGDRLQAAREYAGLSLPEFAKRLGVKKSTALGWEEDLAEPRANKLSMMAGLLNVSIIWLLSGEGEDVKSPYDDDDMVDAGVSALLTEIRDLRSQLTQAGDRLGKLEKRLRKQLKD